MSPPLPFWGFLLTRFLGVSQRMAARIWQHYPASMELKFQLTRCHECAVGGMGVEESLRSLSKLLEPSLLLRAAERLSPPGKPKPREIVAFEERVLGLLDRNGQWIWWKPERKE